MENIDIGQVFIAVVGAITAILTYVTGRKHGKKKAEGAKK